MDIKVHASALLTISEVRGSSTMYSYKEGYKEVTKETRTRFNWKLKTIAAKVDHTADDFDAKDQELYNITITSDGYEWPAGSSVGFKSREDAIKNALEFAKRHDMEVDGYA